ncbi:MAG: alpha/beta fold hydrolase [Candidatus Omnitrophota bacterium]
MVCILFGMQTLISDKDTGVLYRKWEATPAGAAFLLVHGLGAHGGRWSFLAEFLLKYGISSYAIELKGFGATDHPKGHIDSFKTYYNDIAALRGIIRKECPGKKIFLTGESMGALICFMMAARSSASVRGAHKNVRRATSGERRFDGVICISPVFASRLKIPVIGYLGIFGALLYNSRKCFRLPFDSAMCTRDTAYREAMDSDEYEHRFATAKLLFEIAAAQVWSRFFAGRFEASVLFLIAGDDKLVYAGTSARVFRALRTEDKTMIEYPGMYHALSIEEGRERVFEDILKWVEERRRR